MLTRLKVNGFKNLVDVDVRFGPFTCIAGANGVGKSNLFDAIRFLSILADQPFVKAARSVRGEGGLIRDAQALFHRCGEYTTGRMELEVELITPRSGRDDLGEPAKAKATFLRYRIELGLRRKRATGEPLLELLREDLRAISPEKASSALAFPHGPKWRRSVVAPDETEAPLISTDKAGAQRVIRLRRDKGRGEPSQHPARPLTRTVLSAVTGSDNATALLARREMQSWRVLQLEPSALRQPDDFSAPTRLGADGAHLAATLSRLAKQSKGKGRVFEEVANRVRDVVDDLRGIEIDRDEKRELWTLLATDREGTKLPARALSDGTLRFLALAVMEVDPEVQGVMCLEEPENGLHPARIPDMVRLLTDIAVDAALPVGSDNPLRQVIVNTHSPGVVGEVDDDDLLLASKTEAVEGGRRFRRLSLSPLGNTWRARAATKAAGRRSVIARGDLLAYLHPVRPGPDPARNGAHRVADRNDLQRLIWGRTSADD
jgi:predicted ATPase